ncbi:M24 family metallopeptidase [Streptomyces sp. NPDC005811]|uniref:M24 family metallopeptidase n=1 Tax=Streptomyces sp. NPDC005811 TaxID=3154565 RepID=UPI0033F0AAC8
MATEVLPDDRALRTGRRERVLAHMEAHDLDALVLGRGANIRYVTGAGGLLWNAGTHPFFPACVVVRETGSIHLLSTWDEGIPDDIPHENLYPLSWNPANYVKVIRGIPGTATARRVGSDASNPTIAQMLASCFPAAELVDGETALRAARRIKTPEEVTALRHAIGVAETSLAKALAELRPGVTEGELSGALLEAAAAGGVTTPATQEVVWRTSREHRWRLVDDGGRIGAGDLVAFTAGVVADGYIGEVGRTWPVEGGNQQAVESLYRRWDELWALLADACRSGAQASDLLAAYDTAGESLPPMPVARGIGLGFDPPVVTSGLPATAAEERLEPGMVLSVTGYVWQEGVGAVLGREAVLITTEGPELLTTSPLWRP